MESPATFNRHACRLACAHAHRSSRPARERRQCKCAHKRAYLCAVARCVESEERREHTRAWTHDRMPPIKGGHLLICGLRLWVRPSVFVCVRVCAYALTCVRTHTRVSVCVCICARACARTQTDCRPAEPQASALKCLLILLSTLRTIPTRSPLAPAPTVADDDSSFVSREPERRTRVTGGGSKSKTHIKPPPKIKPMTTDAHSALSTKTV